METLGRSLLHDCDAARKVVSGFTPVVRVSRMLAILIIELEGSYVFRMQTDAGSILLVNGKALLEYDGSGKTTSKR
eukprot:2968535-Amphidinium_carterae.1